MTVDRPSPALLRFFRSYYERSAYPGLASGPPEFPERIRLRVATVFLADRRTEFSMVLVDGEDCNPKGDCPLGIVVSRDGGRTFRGLGFVWIVRLPLRVLPTTHHGLPDLGVNTRCRNDLACTTEAVLPFDGERYPDNATTPPSRYPAREEGRTVIPYTDPPKRGLRLYP